MKQILIILLLGLTITSCSKKDNLPANIVQPYLGTYVSSNADTAYITSTSETYTRFYWCSNGGAKISFDSVIVSTDNSVTVNQWVFYNSRWEPVIGVGGFGTNTLQFQFVIDGNQFVNFNGVKRQ